MNKLRPFYLFTGLLLGLTIAVSSFAENQRPANLEPLEEIPAPPSADNDKVIEPKITTFKKGTDTIDEYRINGELYMMKITPAHGVPYYLQRQDPSGAWLRSEGPMPPLTIPKWVIFRF